MPIIDVDGMPATSQQSLKKMKGSIQDAVAAVPVLGVDREAVTVFFHPSMLEEGAGEILVATVQGLYIRPERTVAVEDSLRAAIGGALLDYANEALPGCTRVEAFIGSRVREEQCWVGRPSRQIEGLCPQCSGRRVIGGGEECPMCEGSGRAPSARAD